MLQFIDKWNVYTSIWIFDIITWLRIVALGSMHFLLHNFLICPNHNHAAAASNMQLVCKQMSSFVLSKRLKCLLANRRFSWVLSTFFFYWNTYTEKKYRWKKYNFPFFTTILKMKRFCAACKPRAQHVTNKSTISDPDDRNKLIELNLCSSGGFSFARRWANVIRCSGRLMNIEMNTWKHCLFQYVCNISSYIYIRVA